MFERELEELQKEIKESQQNKDVTSVTEDVSESESVKKGLMSMVKKKPLSFKQQTTKQPMKKGAISTLKFSPSMAKVNTLLGEGSAIQTSASMMQDEN